MIHHLSGTLIEKTADGLIIEAGGVGYKLSCPAGTIQAVPDEGSEVKILTSLIVREDSWQLYGFVTSKERTFFDLLLSVSGIGPKAAVALLSGYSVEQLNKAISTEDEKLLSSVPGIGLKTAKRVIVELKEKMEPSPLVTDKLLEAREALVSLGYSHKEAFEMLTDVEEADTESIVKKALQKMV